MEQLTLEQIAEFVKKLSKVKAEKLDAEIEKVSKSFAEQGAEILSKNGILYA